MIIFRKMRDLQQLQQNDPTYSVIKACLQRTEHLDGYLVLVEGETEINLPELKGHLKDISWEGVSMVDGYFYSVHLTNNEFALQFIFKDTHQLNDAIRHALKVQSID